MFSRISRCPFLPFGGNEPSIHDSLLTGYEIDGKKRMIVMHTEPHQGGGEAFVDVIFNGVVANQFEGDAMSNIISRSSRSLPRLDRTSRW